MTRYPPTLTLTLAFFLSYSCVTHASCRAGWVSQLLQGGFQGMQWGGQSGCYLLGCSFRRIWHLVVQMRPGFCISC